MNMPMPVLIDRLVGIEAYARASRRLTGEGITPVTISAATERTLVSNDTPFDRWLAGDADAMSAAQARPRSSATRRGNCETPRGAGHRRRLPQRRAESFGALKPDRGRFCEAGQDRRWRVQDADAARRGADRALLHDGSARTLKRWSHYVKGGAEDQPR
jgi:cytochrome c peroxidase